MNRRQLIFVILFNAIVSLVIVLVVVWAVEMRRPDPEELAIFYTPIAPAQPMAQSTPVADNLDPAVNVPDTAAPPAAPTPAPTVDVGETETYIVQTGDSLSSIADRFRVPIDTLVRINELPNPDFVFVGQPLRIPQGGGDSATAPTSETAPAPITEGVLIRAIDAPGDLLAEAVQIVNDSDLAINLSGWTLERDGGPSYRFGNLPLFAGSFLWLHTRNGENTSIAIYWGREEAAWPSGSTLRLRNPQGTEVAMLVVP